jgi:hypothetical protein
MLGVALALAAIASSGWAGAPAPDGAIVSGTTWRDTDGQVIEAHGGGVLWAEGSAYWYGENHRLGLGNKTGISCYSSRDLRHWKNEGVVLPREAVPEAYRDAGVCERPKVIFNARTGKYVMWMHLDADDYTHAAAGVAVADSPRGPFHFLHQFRPIAYDYGAPDTPAAQRLAERTNGNAFRDMNLFVDDDRAGYVIYASENNATLYLSRLNDDYTDIVRPAVPGKTWERLLPNHWREAPVLFKCRGKYHLLSSGVSGWAPNAAEHAMADRLFGPWEIVGNPCTGYEAEKTFRSQSTSVVAVPGRGEGAFVYLGDRWMPEALETSSYIWIPFEVGLRGEIVLEPYERWTLDVFEAAPAALVAPVLEAPAAGAHRISWQPVPGAAGYRIFRDGSSWRFTAHTSWSLQDVIPGVANGYQVEAVRLNGAASSLSNSVNYTAGNARDVFLDEVIPDQYDQGWGVLVSFGPAHPAVRAIAGKEFSRGVFTHSRSKLRYQPGGRYETFTASVGRTNAEPNGRVQFRVYGDGRLLFRGETMDGRTAPRAIEVPIAGVADLDLVVLDGGDGADYDSSLWAEARLHARRE